MFGRALHLHTAALVVAPRRPGHRLYPFCTRGRSRWTSNRNSDQALARAPRPVLVKAERCAQPSAQHGRIWNAASLPARIGGPKAAYPTAPATSLQQLHPRTTSRRGQSLETRCCPRRGPAWQAPLAPSTYAPLTTARRAASQATLSPAGNSTPNSCKSSRPYRSFRTRRCALTRYCTTRAPSMGTSSIARTICTPKAWQANDATAPACPMRVRASNARSSSEACHMAASRTRDAKRCRAKRWRSLISVSTTRATWWRSPFDSTDTTTQWPNLWQSMPGKSSARMRSVSAAVRRSSGENSRSRWITLKPLEDCATARASGANSSAMKAASSVPKWQITFWSTSSARGQSAARNAKPCNCSAMPRASAGCASSSACRRIWHPSSSKAKATTSLVKIAAPTGVVSPFASGDSAIPNPQASQHSEGVEQPTSVGRVLIGVAVSHSFIDVMRDQEINIVKPSLLARIRWQGESLSESSEPSSSESATSTNVCFTDQRRMAPGKVEARVAAGDVGESEPVGRSPPTVFDAFDNPTMLGMPEPRRTKGVAQSKAVGCRLLGAKVSQSSMDESRDKDRSIVILSLLARMRWQSESPASLSASSAPSATESSTA
mmetsp:Transcript_116931/g.337935  ORF Transcript_116931/g.337935 Transcript_116931/m.337935 type:complete len:606 (-) Transcript_116931:152-1969(-)